MADQDVDVAVIGAGIAGASAAAQIAQRRRVLLLERESQPGYHATGRSAALFSETYGNAVVRALSRASRGFLYDPPQGFADYPLVRPRGSLHVARPEQLAALEALWAEPDIAAQARRLGPEETRQLCPLLRAGYAAEAVFEPQSADVDVHGLHQGYLRLFRARGGRALSDAEVTALEPARNGWRVHTGRGSFDAAIVVNAAGAWADEVAKAAGLAPLGIVPHRRTALLVDAPAAPDIADMPMVIDIDEQFYFKPDAGKLLLSPADETPSPPCDAQPDELDVAVAVDRVQTAVSFAITRVRRKWAGLRSFAPDRSPVIGYDPRAEGFFWLAGQGGYGIQTAPAAAALAAALLDGEAAADVDAGEVAPARFVAP